MHIVKNLLKVIKEIIVHKKVKSNVEDNVFFLSRE